ncbi:beta strand repeat-containing protein [Helicobacter brantae]|uniref:Autotransporter domain-containing protein n=1 Tax=Helicobacter brantae TaxID=375927 RepID=A0A3D8IZY3_9HELI|nr:hypothetical protein [Helicobacter brantae]RDU70653.1 hypothetical protein CQA58_04745 [Helicobacter brantae]
MRIGISLALSALVSQVVCAEVCPSTASASSTIDDLTISSGATCEITTTKEVKTKIENNGTLILKGGITFKNGGSYSITSANNGFGTILVKNSVTIDASSTTATQAEGMALTGDTNTGGSLTIDSQDITIDKGKTLTLKATTITLGGNGTSTSTGTSSAIGLAEATTTDKHTSITGDSSILTSTSTKNVVLSTTTTLNTKDLILKNARIDGGSTLENLKNTKLELNGGFITSSATSGLTLSAEGSSSTFTITGDSNSISSGTNALNIQGTHSFSGSGTLDFIGNTITLGNGDSTKLTLNTDSSENTPKLRFQASTKLLLQSVENTGLTLQVINGSDKATAYNISSTFSGGTLQAINTSDKDNVLVIENGVEDLATTGVIKINNGTTTFKGSGVQIYGQDITLSNSGNTTLTLATIDDEGEIVLGKTNTPLMDSTSFPDKKDGDVSIVGESSNSQTLQLRSLTTTFGGSVTLKNLKVATQSSNSDLSEGMVFVIDDSSLIVENVDFVSGIDTNYQSLSLTSSQTPKNPTFSVKAKTNIKGSSLLFENQSFLLMNASSELNLYSYGNVALSNTQGSGVGNFAFENTTISDGSGASLNLYSAERAKVLANGLTLNNVTLTTYKIDNTKIDNKNAIDLSTKGNDITTQGSVTIDTGEFFYGGGTTQGIGMDITIIGGEQGDGKLTLTSGTSGESFTFGGTLTIDNSSAGASKPDSSTSQIEIKLDSKENNGTKQEVDLIINGGLTAKGNAGENTTTTLKAKSFTFGEGSVVSSINGTLSLSATENGDIDLKQALTILQGVANAEATISKGSGNLSLGNVIATGKTKIENATFSDSSIAIRSIDNSANTLTISSSSAVSGVKSIDIKDAMLEVKNGTSQELQLNVDGSITSNGDSTITASSIKGSNGSGTYSINVGSGTLTLKETTSAGDGIGSVTLGSGTQGGNLELIKDNVDFNSLKTTKITSNGDSSISAESFDFSDGNVSISSNGGTLSLNARSASDRSLTIKSGKIALNDGGLDYTYSNFGQNSGVVYFYEKTNLLESTQATPTSIQSNGDSFIKGSSLDFKDNTITSSGGVLTLQGLSATSTLGAVTINNAGGLTATTSDGSTTTDIKLDSTLTLTANAPYTSSSSPLGGGKFGVLQAQSVNFTQNGGTDSPLIFIKVLDKPLEGEELFTLKEGGQVVVQTSGGITKNNGSKNPITLEDISLDNGGYKSLSLSAELVPDSTKENQVNAIKVLLSVAQSSASEIAESISDNSSKAQMQTLLTQGDNQTIIDSILSSPTNPLKVGFAENIAQGNVVVVGNALNYIDDTFTSLSQSLHLNDRIQSQIALSQASVIEGRLARHNNPHQISSELAKFIRTYHNTRYASSDEGLLSEEEQTLSGNGSLWASYDGGLATGNGSNSTINGVSAGYDHAISPQALLGGFVAYSYGIFDGTFLHNTSHNVSLGLYSRAYFGSNEIDLSLSQNVALITSEINVGNTTMPSLLNGAMQYNLYRTTLTSRYGYTFKVGEEESPYYLKPLVGLNLSYTYQEGAESGAVASVGINALSLFKMDLSVGMEMRKYISEGTYFFLMPLVERDLYGSSCEVDVGFVDSPSLRYTLDYQSQTSVAIYGGGEGNLTENLALNGSLGVKVGIEKSEVLTSWSVGLKYKF